MILFYFNMFFLYPECSCQCFTTHLTGCFYGVWSDRKSREKMELLRTSTRLWAAKAIFQKKTQREREKQPNHLISLSDRNWAPILFPVFRERDSHMQNLACRLSSVMRNVVRQFYCSLVSSPHSHDKWWRTEASRRKKEGKREGCNVSAQIRLSDPGLWVGIHMLSFKMTNQNNTRFIYPATLGGSFLAHGFTS